MNVDPLREKCSEFLAGYNTHFNMHLHVRKFEEDEKIERLQNLLRYCKKLNDLFIEYKRIWSCIPADAWKMYDLLDISGLQEQNALKKAEEALDDHLKARPKLLIKGRVLNDRKKVVYKIQERNPA